ncbi:porin [Peristeroidobacter soli]|jgi:predicted porin|uniref:porin n=1 Tax=Peristeroidobacter soli TaxID=2497877 RepID=UPI00101CDFEB|nr:porin [Peristeroidobacter soli]
MRTEESRNGSTHILWYAAAAVLLASLSPRPAAAVEVPAGDWKLTASGNVNVYYIHSSCEDQLSLGITGGLACRGGAGVTNSSSISNGLLPAALAIGASTTQKGLDLSVTFGFYPGISTNDGSPNLQQGAPLLNTALGTTAIDMRQVFMTFGNKQIGEFMLGRNIGLFGADAILNDMTLPGVGAGNGNYAAPANTSLGSIGLGYIYTDWLGQINYTTPSFGGFKLTVGVFDPLEPITQGTPTPEGSPGYHAKIAYKADKFYLSASFISQKHEGPLNVGDFDSTGWDAGGKVTLAGLEVMGWYYSGKGMGTTALYLFGATALGQERDSDGFLAQVTYKFGDLKVGVNYGQSNLDLASGEAPSDLVKTNEKYTGGVYYSLTENLTLIGEYSDIKSKSHNNIENKSNNFNIGAYLSF